MTDSDKGLFFRVIVILLVIVLVAFMIKTAQRNQQVVGPNSVQPQPIQQIPAIIEFLTNVKICCENHATAAKQPMRRPLLQARALREGRVRYNEVEARASETISFFQAALTRRIKNEDSAALREKLATVDKARDHFLDWGNKVQNEIPPGACMAAGIEDIPGLVVDWLSGLQTADSEAIRQLRDDLERCRLQKWEMR